MIMTARFLFHPHATVAFDFGDCLGRGEALDQSDFRQAKHDMTGTMRCRSGDPATMTSASRKAVAFSLTRLAIHSSGISLTLLAQSGE
jgi:hypothetical protein